MGKASELERAVVAIVGFGALGLGVPAAKTQPPLQQKVVPVVLHAVPTQGQAHAAAQTELDKKLAAIMKSDGTPADAKRRIEQLEQFVRDNPTFPTLERVYANLLTFLRYQTPIDASKTLAWADDALKKFPNPKVPVRANAVGAKYAAYRTQKDDGAVAALSQALLASETDPAALEEAADADKSHALKLYEKAVAERAKNASADDYPRLDGLRWSYAQCLKAAGREEEALRIWTELIETDRQELARLEALPKNDAQRKPIRRLRMTMGSRYEDLAGLFSDRKDYDRALRYVTLTEEVGAYNPLEATARYANQRADIYAKAGKAELELEQRIRALAARLDPKFRDKIAPLAAKLGTSFDAALARARDIRKTTAVPVAPFELKTLDGKVVTLEGVRGKVTVVNFFFPT